jgi:DNA-binding FadR family transcriptional regulator
VANGRPQQFNVSRQTIHEAMRVLEHCGFIAIQQGFKVGPLIAHTILNRMAGLLLHAVSFRNISIGELTKARFDIENVMLRHVIDRANDSGTKTRRRFSEVEKRIETQYSTI